MSKNKKNKTKTVPVYDLNEEVQMNLNAELEDYENRLTDRRIRLLEETIIGQAKHIVNLQRQIELLREWDEQSEIYDKYRKDEA